MPKNFSGSVKTPRRNRLAEALDKGTAAAPQEDTQQETALEDPSKIGEMPKEPEPTPAPIEEETGGAGDIETRLAEGRTQGKRGLFAKRINMAFLPEVYDYIHVMAYSNGKTLTTFVNESLLYMMQHDPEYLELRAIKERREARLKANDQE